jgi:hypothetical protein
LPVFALRLLLTYGAPSLVLLGIIRAGCLLSHRQTVLLMSARLAMHVPQQHAGYRVVFLVTYCPNCDTKSKHSSSFFARDKHTAASICSACVLTAMLLVHVVILVCFVGVEQLSQ